MIPTASKLHAPSHVVWIPVSEAMPEDEMPHKKYKMWGRDRESTEYVLVIREYREKIDVAKRVLIEGRWYWHDGDGLSEVTHWARVCNPFFDAKEHKKFLESVYALWRGRR